MSVWHPSQCLRWRQQIIDVAAEAVVMTTQTHLQEESHEWCTSTTVMQRTVEQIKLYLLSIDQYIGLFVHEAHEKWTIIQQTILLFVLSVQKARESQEWI